jgi:ABC-type multidrug transport system fused ATPase/permease subunit
MVKRNHRRADEIMLIPFLDILCSLIGVLVLIIVVLCVAQLQKINGRTVEELQRAEEAMKMRKQQKENDRINDLLKDKVVKLEELQKQTKERQEEFAKLRKLLDTSVADREKNKVASEKLMKELDDLLIEVNGLTTQEPPLKKEIAALQAEIAKRKPPANKGAPVVVSPGGSGLAKGSKVFFVEASGGKLAFYWDEKTKMTISSAPDVVAVDAGFNAFLKAVAAVPQSKIIFLLRDDGMGAFNTGAGWAQATHGYQVGQIGKLPIPGRGEIDLKMFKEYLGALTPPPEVTKPPATPVPAKPPGAPGTPAAATPAPPKTTPAPAKP